MKFRTLMLITAMVMLLGTLSAYAIPTLDFGIIAPTTGSISYAGGTAPLIGSGIDVDNVVGLNTLLHNNEVLPLSNAFLNFTTGDLVSSTSNQWIFGGGSDTSITIVGGVPSLGIADGTTLLSGSFGNAIVTVLGDTFRIAGASFTDVKNETLALYYFPTLPPAWSGNFNISFSAAGTPPGSFSSTQVLSGDVTNVPEPASLTFLGCGLLGLYILGRKRHL